MSLRENKNKNEIHFSFVYSYVFLEIPPLGSSLVAQRDMDPELSLLLFGHCCGMGSTPGPGTSTY